jgi:hypothetical protein
MKTCGIKSLGLLFAMAALLCVTCAVPAFATLASDDYSVDASTLSVAGGTVGSNDYEVVGTLSTAAGQEQMQVADAYSVVPAAAGLLQAATPTNIWMFY